MGFDYHLPGRSENLGGAQSLPIGAIEVALGLGERDDAGHDEFGAAGHGVRMVDCTSRGGDSTQ